VPRSKRSDDASERALLERAAAGDREAAAACVDRLGPRIQLLVERFGYRDDEAERAVRAIFRRLWSQAGRPGSGAADQVTFSVQVARRWLLDRRARARVEGAPAVEVAAAAEPPSQGQPDLFGPAAGAARALAALAPEERTPLQLAVLGTPYTRIAQGCGSSVNAVREVVRRALVQVGEQLHAGPPRAGGR
jgi:DNA-directed RNA polymerase specialized sigma24 family protein